MLSFIQNIGRTALTFLSALGRLTLFSVIAVRWIFTPPYYWQQLLRQIIDIGYYSLPVVGLTTLFSGMVLALQSYTGFARFSAEDTVATVVVLSVTGIGAGIGRADGGGTHWRLNGGRDWHDAGYRPD